MRSDHPAGLQAAPSVPVLASNGQSDAAPSDPVRPYEYGGWGILNPYGQLWTPEWFEEPEDAFDHMKAFWGANYEEHARGFKVVPVYTVLTAHSLELAVSPPWDQPGTGSADPSGGAVGDQLGTSEAKSCGTSS